jgi:hypothetical protein
MSFVFMKRLACLIALSLIPASTAMAQGQTPASKPLGMYSSFDIAGNKDGKVSLAEFQAGYAAQLSRFDTNRDGKMTVQEVAAVYGPRISAGGLGAKVMQERLAELKAADTNHDGIITVEELDAISQVEFRTVDRNGDGYIDTAEATAPAS